MILIIIKKKLHFQVILQRRTQMPKPAKPQTTAKPNAKAKISKPRDALNARRHRKQMDGAVAVLEPAPTLAPTPTDYR